jgi:hypothetical protein
MLTRKALMHRLLRSGVLAACLLVSAVQADAQNVTVRGSGTCKEYLDDERNSVDDAVKDLTWLLGYLSGLAVATHVDVLGKADNAVAMLNWVNSYCQTHPTIYLSDAGDQYYKLRIDQMKADAEKVRQARGRQ